jgi:hypothetical protein
MQDPYEQPDGPIQPMKRKQLVPSFEQSYPHITRWVKTQGWIEIGEDDYSHPFVRALDAGGMVWEGQEQGEYATMDDMLNALEEGLTAWMREQWGEGES